MEYAGDTQDKLIVLYIISKLTKSVTNLQLVDLVLDVTGIDYFTLQDILLGLNNQGFISLFYEEEVRYYKITPEGEELLESLIGIVPDFIISRVTDKVDEESKEVKQKSVIYADFFPDGKDRYNVKCKISEGGKKAIELELVVSAKEQAIEICNKWYENPSKYYLEILKLFS